MIVCFLGEVNLLVCLIHGMVLEKIYLPPHPREKKPPVSAKALGQSRPAFESASQTNNGLIDWKRRSQYLTKLWYFTNHQSRFPWNNTFPLLNYLVKGEVR